MKKLFRYKPVALLLILFILMSCNDSSNQIKEKTVLPNDDVSAHTAFDDYLKQLYLDNYNIRYEYKYVDSESDRNHVLVPAETEKAVLMANMIHYLCLEPYRIVAPNGFLEKYFPKQIFLIGSAAYLNNGSRILGTAEGGLKVVLYDINNLPANTEEVSEEVLEDLQKDYFRTIFHEFSHILHQVTDYSADFEQISAGPNTVGSKYVGDSWSTYWNESNSLTSGFISNYASKNRNEDFVEMIAHYITYSDQRWENTLSSAGAARPLLEGKIEIVKDYLLTIWKINVDALKVEVRSRIESFNHKDFKNICPDNPDLIKNRCH